MNPVRSDKYDIKERHHLDIKTAILRTAQQNGRLIFKMVALPDIRFIGSHRIRIQHPRIDKAH